MHKLRGVGVYWWIVGNLYAVRQKAENFVEGNLLGSDVEFAM